MTRAIAAVAHLLAYGALAGFIGLFSRWPTYVHLPPDRALIKLSLVHHGQRLHECRALSPEELAKLPPTMRMPTDCPRERAPVTVEIDIDDAPALRKIATPSGLARDGAAAMYERLAIEAGSHRIAVRLKDTSRDSGFDYERVETVTLRPAQILVIDFDASRGGITLQ